MPSFAGARVVVHDRAQVRRALASGTALNRPVTLLSAPGAAAQLGALVFSEMVASVVREDDIRTPVTAILDCGDAPGPAMRALRQGCRHVRCAAAPETAAKLRDMAGQYGASLDVDGSPALDLGRADVSDDALRDWISGDRHA